MNSGRRQIDTNKDDEALSLAKEGASAMFTPARERTIIRHLPYFVTLAEDGNFNRASERLGLSQSALTRRIQTLEEELGILLFTRTHRSARLTAAGQALLEDAGRILGELRGATRRAQLVSRGEAGVINVAFNEPALRSPAVIGMFRTLRERYPDVQIQLSTMPSEAQMIALRRKDIDLGFVFDISIDAASRRTIECLSVSRIMSFLAVHESHPLAQKSAIRLADLEHEWLTWPSSRAGRSASETMIAAFEAAGLSPNIALEVMAEETTVNLAAANLGMGFVLESLPTPPSVTLRRVEDYQHSVTLQAVWLANRENAGVLRIVEELRRQIELFGTKV